jgi:hypothetical protein
MQDRSNPADRPSFAGSSPGRPGNGGDVAGTPAGPGFDGGHGDGVAAVAAVCPPGWDAFEDVPLTEDERWELRFGDGGGDLSVAELDALLAQLPPGALADPEMDGEGEYPAAAAGMWGLMPRDLPAGGGFDAGGVADQVPAGLALAALAERTWDAGLAGLNDDELVGLALAWRRLHSWATAGELAAVAELGRRRARAAETAGEPGLADHLGDELAIAMTLTGRSADALLDFAHTLARLPGTRAALAAGQIDQARARVLADELAGLDGPLAAAVERTVLARAPQQTTSQLRAAAKRAVLKADPAAARKRQEAARCNARVEVWHEPSGTASLAGRDLPPAEVLAADQRITALARRLKGTGHDGTLDQLRARVYTALLLGQSLDDPAAPAPASTAPEPDGPAAQPGGLRGSVNLTLPLATWLGTSDAPGDLAGLGPIPNGDARALAQALAIQPGNRWCLTLTGPQGHAIAHGCTTTAKSTTTANGDRNGNRDATGNRNGSSDRDGSSTRRHSDSDSTRRHSGGGSRAGHGKGHGGSGPPGQLTITLIPLAVGTCGHRLETPGYHPTNVLRHTLHIRQRSCSAPGCRRPATGCDLDHTRPYAQGGRTCECGLAPLCRRHHRAKQAYGWKLEQPQPGVLVWRLPHGRTYRVEPGPYLE